MSFTGVGDKFGLIVSLSGDFQPVGAFQKSSRATGIGDNQADNPTKRRAVYVRRRLSPGSASLYQASNTEAGGFLAKVMSLSATPWLLEAPLVPDPSGRQHGLCL